MPESRKLGRNPEIKDRPRLQFASALKTVPEHPIGFNSTVGLVFGMDGNDIAGDCVVAGWDHYQQTVKALLAKSHTVLTQQEIWDLYKTQNPDFNPSGSGSTNGPGSNADGGMVIQLFLEELLKRNLVLGFARVNQTNEDEVKAAIYLGLALVVGGTLTYAQVADQFDKRLWDYVPGDMKVGGHCFTMSLYDTDQSPFGGVTWGTVVDMTKAFIDAQVEEIWFVLMPEHVAHADFWQHYDVQKFAQAVSDITDGKVVVPTPSPPQPQPQPDTLTITDDYIAARIVAAAHRSHLTPDQWATKHFQHYFRE